MNLAGRANNLLIHYTKPTQYSSAELDAEEKMLENALRECQDVNEIEQMLAVDTKLYLPINIRALAYERLLSLGRRTWHILAGYAAHLSMYYPHNSEEGQRSIKLFEEAMILKREEENKSVDNE